MSTTLDSKLWALNKGFPPDGKRIEALLRETAEMPLKQFFAYEPSVIKSFYKLLDVSPREVSLEDMPYRKFASLIHRKMSEENNPNFEEVLDLLASPFVQYAVERGEFHG